MTIVVAGDNAPQLSGESGSFAGTWDTLARGSTQFSDRGYTLSGVPSDLLGQRYFKGPCHSGVGLGGPEISSQESQ